MARSSRKMAVSGMMVALGTVVMLLGGVIPAATFCCPALAALALLPLVFDCGKTYAWSGWAAIGLLSLMLCPNKEAAMLFVFLGHYPVLKWDLDARIKKRWLRRVVKFILWNACIAAMYALIFYVLRLDQIIADYKDTTLVMTAVSLMLGNITLALYDVALMQFSAFYLMKLRPKLFH